MNQKTDDNHKEISERLKLLRDVMGWSQAEVARRFGVSKSAVTHWESGQTKMSGPAIKLLEIFERKAKRFEEGE